MTTRLSRDYSDQRGKPTIEYPDGPNVYLAEEIKKCVDVPVVTVGKLGNPEFADEVIATGRADMVALARPLIADQCGSRKLRTAAGQDNRVPLLHRCLYEGMIRQPMFTACATHARMPVRQMSKSPLLDFARRGMYKGISGDSN